jgi:hypothetical protein
MAKKIDDPGGLEFTVPAVPGLKWRLVECTMLDEEQLPWAGWCDRGRPAKSKKGVDDAEYTTGLLFVLPVAGRDLDGWSFLGPVNEGDYFKHWLTPEQIGPFEEYLLELCAAHDIAVDLDGCDDGG